MRGGSQSAKMEPVSVGAGVGWRGGEGGGLRLSPGLCPYEPQSAEVGDVSPRVGYGVEDRAGGQRQATFSRRGQPAPSVLQITGKPAEKKLRNRAIHQTRCCRGHRMHFDSRRWGAKKKQQPCWDDLAKVRVGSDVGPPRVEGRLVLEDLKTVRGRAADIGRQAPIFIFINDPMST